MTRCALGEPLLAREGLAFLSTPHGRILLVQGEPGSQVFPQRPNGRSHCPMSALFMVIPVTYGRVVYVDFLFTHRH